MGLTFKTSITPERLRQRVTVRPEVVQAEMLVAETEIVRRTQAQKGIEGQALPSLSPAYAAHKAKAGRNPVPDRTFTGRLLKAIHSKLLSATPERIEGRIYFQEQQHGKRSTISQVARAMQQLAPFFGLSRAQRRQLVEAVKKNLGK